MDKDLNSCLVVLEWVGLQFFSLKHLNSRNIKDKPTILRTIIMITLVSALTLFVVFLFSNVTMSKEKVNARNVLMHAILSFLNIGVVAVIDASIIQSYILTCTTKNIFLNMKLISQLGFKEFGRRIEYKKIKKAALKRGLVVVVFFIATHIILTYSAIKTIEDVVGAIIISIPTFICYAIVYKFVFYVDLINNQLKFFEKLVDEISECRKVEITEGFDFHLVSVGTKNESEDLMRKSRAARKIYILIFESVNLVNSSNGFAILLVIVDMVISLTSSGYELSVVALGGLSVEKIMGALKLIQQMLHSTSLSIGPAYTLVFAMAILVSTVAYCQTTVGFVSSNKLKKR